MSRKKMRIILIIEEYPRWGREVISNQLSVIGKGADSLSTLRKLIAHKRNTKGTRRRGREEPLADNSKLEAGRGSTKEIRSQAET
jgi:hypothetical protein